MTYVYAPGALSSVFHDVKYTSCGSSDYHPVGAYYVPLVIALGINSLKVLINPFQTNVPHADEPGGWFLPVKCLKNTCGKVTF